MRRAVIFVFLIVAICCMFVGTLFVTSAEVDSNAIYTYNQLVKNGNFATADYWKSYFGATFTISNSEVSILANQSGGISQSGFNFAKHKYFLSVESYGSSDSDTLTINLTYNPQVSFDLTTSYQTYNTIIDVTYIAPSYGLSLYILPTIGSVVYLRNLYIIDLTLMFGSGNEPTVEECRALFPSDYYVYSPGTSLTMNGVGAYQQGVNDTLNSYVISTYPDVTVDSMFPISINNVDSFLHLNEVEDSVSAGMSRGYVGVPFGVTVSAGTRVRLNFKTIQLNDILDFGNILQFGYINSNNVFVPLLTVDTSAIGVVDKDRWYYENSYFDFLIPVDSEYLVIYTPGNLYKGDAAPLVFAFIDFSFDIYSFNNQILIDNAYNNGYDLGYDNGNSFGYNKGYAAGLVDGTNNDYTFLGLLSSVVQAPVTVLVGEFDSATGERVGGLLNFEFLGYNMSTLLMSLFSIGLVICIVRLFV